MTGITELRRTMEEIYRRDAAHLPTWPDPHADRSPTDDEYSRVLDPAKWRIVTARADAWATALTQLGVAELARDAAVEWLIPHGSPLVRIDRLVSRRPGALPLVLGYRGFESLDDNALVVAAADPAAELELVPHCGCDACDHGSEEVLEVIDGAITSVVCGVYRRLTDGDRWIDVRADGWSASGEFGDHEIDDALRSPKGWSEVSGSSWLD